MRLIKAILTGAVVLFVVITLFSLVIPSSVRVSRAVTITNVHPGEIYGQVATFENWRKWHPVFTADSAKIYCYGPALAGESPGCRIIHHGKEIIIRLLSADSNSVKFLLQAKGENDIDNNIVIAPLPAQGSVVVEWRSITRLHWYPWEKFYGIFIDKLAGPGYEAALNALKDYLEKGHAAPQSRP